MLTFDNARQTQDSKGNHMGNPLPYPVRTHDGKTVDSTGDRKSVV